ncbi:hypothetical protein GCM10027614_65980 [Micromonospora vulcania]
MSGTDRDTRRTHAALPAAMRESVDDFAAYLSDVRNRSAHTIRAYVADLVSLLDHASRMGCTAPADLDLTVLRSWLARLRTAGAARTSLARRAASARTFSSWAHRSGLLATDVAAPLASPRAHRELPTVLRADQAAALVEAPGRTADVDRVALPVQDEPNGVTGQAAPRAPGRRIRAPRRCRCATGCCWSCSMPPAYGSAKRADWTSATSTMAAG